MPTWRINRSGSGVPDSEAYVTSSQTFGSHARNETSVTLLVTNEQSRGIQHYVMAGNEGRGLLSKLRRQSGNPEWSARNAATAVGGRAELVDESDEAGQGSGPPDLNLDKMYRLVANHTMSAARETQAGSTPGQVATYLGTALPVDTWVAVTLRRPSKSETVHTRSWYDFRLGGASTHHTKAPDVMVGNIIGGGDGMYGILPSVSAALPGFDIETKAERVGGPVPRIVATVLSAVTIYLGLTWLAGFARRVTISRAGKAEGQLANFFLPLLDRAWMVAAVVLLLGVYFTLRNPQSRWRRLITSGRFPVPGKRPLGGIIQPKPPRKEGINAQGKFVKATSGDYPLQKDTFMVGPSVVLGVVCPFTGTASGVSVTQTDEVPMALRSNIGPLIGDVGGVPAHLSQADRYAGVAIIGKPGSGKSVVVQNLFAYDLMRRRMNLSIGPRLEGDVGARNTLVVFENKGSDGIGKYIEWLKVIGSSAYIVELADDQSFAIDMFDMGNTIEEKASFFAQSMQYAFGTQAIADRSLNTLSVVFSAALAINADDLAAVNLPPCSPVRIASVLLSARGDELGMSLASSFTKRVAAMPVGDPGREELMEIVQRLGLLYGGNVTASQRRNLTEAPVSKVNALLTFPGWWEQKRNRVKWSHLLTHHHVVLINTGQSQSSNQVDENLTVHLTSMLTFGLHQAMKKHCVGWKDAGRAVTIYSDEFSLLVGMTQDERFPNWLKDQGRSFGVRPVFATQRPGQLTPVIRGALLSFGTMLWYAQESDATAKEAAVDLGAGGEEWVSSQIINMPQWHGALRAQANGHRQPPFTMKVAFWDDRRQEFLTAQMAA